MASAMNSSVFEPDKIAESIKTDNAVDREEPDKAEDSTELECTSGSIEPNDVSGSLEPQTIPDIIELTDVSGSIEPQNVSDSIEPDDVSGSIEPNNVSGSIEPDNGSGSIEPDSVSDTMQPDKTLENAEPDKTVESMDGEKPSDSMEVDEVSCIIEPSDSIDHMEPPEALSFYIRKVLDAIDASTTSGKQDNKPPARPPRTLQMHLPPDAQQVLVFVIANGSSDSTAVSRADVGQAKVSNDDARVRIVEQQGIKSTSTVLVIDQWGGTNLSNKDVFTGEDADERALSVVVDLSKHGGKQVTAMGSTFSDSDDMEAEDNAGDWSPHAADVDSSDKDNDVDTKPTKKSLKRKLATRHGQSSAKRPRTSRRPRFSYKCEDCGMEFDDESTIDVHSCKGVNDERCFICKFCGEKCTDRDEFWTHYRSHVQSDRQRSLQNKPKKVPDENLPWECADCEARFRLRDDLRAHKREAHPPKPTCSKCKDEFTTKEELEEHRESAHPVIDGDGHKCVDCPQVFEKLELLEAHCKETDHVSHVLCTVCDEKFTSRNDLRKHKRVIHQMKNYCQKCTEVFLLKDELVEHRELAHGIKYECEECERKFADKHSLQKHKREVHPQPKTHMCVFCEKMFAKESALKVHQAQHLESENAKPKDEDEDGEEEEEENEDSSEEKKYECERCDRSFANRFAFQKHIVIAHGERLFACSVCNVVLQTRKDLVRHKETHKEKLVCEQCGRQYRHRRDLLRHLPTHSDERPFPCKICKFRFHTEDRLRNHLAIHAEKRYLCDLCPMKFTDGQHLRRHQKSHAYKQRQRVNSLIFRCLMCPVTFDSPTRLQQHYNTEHPLAEFRCVECNNQVGSFDLLKTHFRTQHKGKVIHCCRVCGDAFDKKQKFLTHRNRFHKVPKYQPIIGDTSTSCSACEKTFVTHSEYVAHLTDEKCKEAAAVAAALAATSSNEILNEPKHFKCLPCSLEFPTSSHLAAHSAIHGSKFPIPCDICGMTLEDALKVSEHVSTHLSISTWSCVECRKTLSSRQSLRMHMGTHGVVCPFTCTICSKTFNSRNALETHMNVHTGNEPFRCNRCDASYKQPIQLKAHLLSHDGRKMYECADCTKTFAARASLVAHLEIHVSGHERPIPLHECTICGKVFDHKANLSNHLRTHNGEKGLLKKHFACDRCKRTFTTRAHLIIHEQSHNGGSPGLVCPVCQRKFKTLKALQLHMRIHTSESPVCPICHKSFTIQRSLEEHMQLHDEEGDGIKCPNCNAVFRSQHSFHKHKAQCCSIFNSQICRQCGLGYIDAKKFEDHTKACDIKNNRRTTDNVFIPQPPKFEQAIVTDEVGEDQNEHIVLVPVDHAEHVVENAPEMHNSMIVADESCHLMVQNALQAIVGENLERATHDGTTAADLEQLIESQAPTELILDGPQGKVRVQFIYETTA